MKIIIIGGGKVGSKISEQLSKESHDVIMIDKNIDVINRINSHQDVSCINGSAFDYEILKEAGVEETDLVIGCTSSDEINMFSCLLAKKLGAKNTIARVRNPEYYNQLNYIKDDLGMSMVINPEYVAANEISRILRFPSAMKVETFAKGKVELIEFKLYENSPLIGRKISEIIKNIDIRMLICAVQRGNELVIPDGNVVLKEGDKLNISATHENLEKFLKKVGGLKRKIRTVMIIGGGKIAYYLCKSLEKINIDVKIIDNNYETCKRIANLLPKVTVIHGDGTDKQLLDEEGINDVDAFITLTGIDEENLILSLYAKTKNVSKIVTKVSQSTFQELLNSFDLDTVISPKDLTGNIILRYVKAMDDSYASKLNYLYRIIDDKVEVLEFTVREGSKVIDTPLMDLNLRKDLLIASIVRGNKIIIPGGKDIIKANDNIIIVTSNLNLCDVDEIVKI